MSFQSHKLVRPEHLNHFGYLFGGYLLQWVDEISWIAASLEYPGCQFVTVAMDRVEFRKSIGQGTVLTIQVTKQKHGKTSVQYEVEVFQDKLGAGEKEQVFSTHITFVRIGEGGAKLPLPNSR